MSVQELELALSAAKRDHKAALATVAREATGAMLMLLHHSLSTGVDDSARRYHAVMNGHLAWNSIAKLWEKK